MRNGYRLENGCRIQRQDVYDGYRMQERFFILLPNGDTYYSFDTFEKARDFAKDIKTWVLSLGFQNGQQGGDTIYCRKEDIDRTVQARYGDEVAEIADYIEA